jgi:hypothetical protein
MVKTMELSDLGCRDVPKGGVYLDLFYYGRGENVFGEAHHLPFKDKAFFKVYSKHCLEHLESPFAFFKKQKEYSEKEASLSAFTRQTPC